MEISNLNYFVERIVDLSTSNQVLCEQRREFEDKIENLEQHISLLKEACGEKDERIQEYIIVESYSNTLELDNIELKNANKLAHERIKELESLEAFHTQDDHPEYPTRFTLHNVEYFENAQGCFMIANDGNETFSVEITHQEYLDGVNQYIKTQE